ncbi:MAG: nucleotidyl transferase AbiEii/AbiGii toxin family protein [Candidatus Gottesmanbacteria bacterium]
MTDAHKSILSNRQQKLLGLFASHSSIKKYFYLSGGTALAEYYLHHRYSEDLDFFTEEEVAPISIQVFIRDIAKKAGVKDVDFQQSFNRNLVFLHFDNEIIKTEFTYYPFTQLEPTKEINGQQVDSLIDIAVNKTFTIYQKPRSRDFIDLYLIIKEKGWNFLDLRKKARIKFDTHIEPLQMAQQLLEVEHLEDFPRMIIELDHKELQEFWKKEAAKIKSEVLI